jgi:uncharacterized protein
MTLLQAIVLFIAAMLGGVLNSVAGGGSFISFPALIFTGVPPINANATNTVALWPGSVASMGAYRKELASQNRVIMLVLSITSLIGGIFGALLLLNTSQATFTRLIPYLLLLATLLFTFSSPIMTRLRARKRNIGTHSIEDEEATSNPSADNNTVPIMVSAKDNVPNEQAATSANAVSPIPADKDNELIAKRAFIRPSWLALSGIALLQLIIATYGGYFGGGIGILMLASLGIMGMENIHEMNGLKTFLTSFINGVAVIAFAIAGKVYWLQGVLMVIGAIIGGYAGAYYARQLDPRLVRGFVILVGFGMTIYFFVRS